MNIFKKSVFFVILLITFVSGCMHPRLELSEEKRHFVRYGETLYFIAWRYGINPQDLIVWNKISDKALIYPGQILKLSSPKNIRSTESLSPRIQKKTNMVKKGAIQSNAKWRLPTKGNVIKQFKRNHRLQVEFFLMVFLVKQSLSHQMDRWYMQVMVFLVLVSWLSSNIMTSFSVLMVTMRQFRSILVILSSKANKLQRWALGPLNPLNYTLKSDSLVTL